MFRKEGQSKDEVVCGRASRIRDRQVRDDHYDACDVFLRLRVGLVSVSDFDSLAFAPQTS